MGRTSGYDARIRPNFKGRFYFNIGYACGESSRHLNILKKKKKVSRAFSYQMKTRIVFISFGHSFELVDLIAEIVHAACHF